MSNQGGNNKDLLDFGIDPEDIIGVSEGDPGYPLGDSEVPDGSHAMGQGEERAFGLEDSFGFNLEEALATNTDRVIPITQKLETIRFYKDAKDRELREYRSLCSEYQSLQLLKKGFESTNIKDNFSGDQAMQALMTTIVDPATLGEDINTPMGKNRAAIKLACYTLQTSKGLQKEVQLANELLEMLEDPDSSELLYEKLLSSDILAGVYHNWLQKVNSMKRIHAVGQGAINTRRLRQMKEVEERIAEEQKLFEAAEKDLDHVTYPMSVDQVRTSSGVRHTYVCGSCQNNNPMGLPFFSVSLFDTQTVNTFMKGGTPTERLNNLCVTYRGNQCPHCGAFNVVPMEFATKMKEEILGKIQSGSLNSKNADKFSLGTAFISQAVLSQINEEILSAMPEMKGLLPEYTTEVEEAKSEYLDMSSVLPELQRYKEKYWSVLKGAYRMEEFSKVQQLRSYGYLVWLADKYPSDKYSLDQTQILSYLIKQILSNSELKRLADDHEKIILRRYTAEKLKSVIDALFSGLYGEELVSTGFIKEGLKALEELGVKYDGEDWETGLSISAGVKSTPGLEKLAEWTTGIAEVAKKELGLNEDKIKSYLIMHPSNGPVEYDSIPVTDTSMVSSWVLQIMVDMFYEQIMISTVARMITAQWDCDSEDAYRVSGVFLKGFGSESNSRSDRSKIIQNMGKHAKDILERIRGDWVGENGSEAVESQALKKMKADIGESETEIVENLLKSIGLIATNERFADITGISASYLKVDKDKLYLKVPSESTRILSLLFTYNSEYSIVPKTILDNGIQYAGAYLVAMNADSANEDAINTAIMTVASEMVLLSPRELWRDAQERYGELCMATDVD